MRFYFWYTFSKNIFLGRIPRKKRFILLFYKMILLLLQKVKSNGMMDMTDSDTYGLYDDHIVIRNNDSRENVLETDGWWLSISDLR